jgi:DNA-binding protein H-NS
MTKTYAQIVKQIEALKEEAEQARREEMAGVIGRIRDAIEAYGLSAEDLGFGGAARRARGSAGPGRRRGAKLPAVIKYRNDSGGTWGGRGKRPQWLRDALAAGKKLEDFAV